MVEPTHLKTISEIGSESFPQITVNTLKKYLEVSPPMA